MVLPLFDVSTDEVQNLDTFTTQRLPSSEFINRNTATPTVAVALEEDRVPFAPIDRIYKLSLRNSALIRDKGTERDAGERVQVDLVMEALVDNANRVVGRNLLGDTVDEPT